MPVFPDRNEAPRHGAQARVAQPLGLACGESGIVSDATLVLQVVQKRDIQKLADTLEGGEAAQAE
ncbi:MAG TPA: hypothetical protein VFQ61_11750 [Polyangiaceae bacterium]|nr:hypothetical protein [Polyangiaceae bacterium]